MSQFSKQRWAVLLIMGTGVAIVHQFAPWPLLAAAIVVWWLKKPWGWLLGGALAAELFSSLSPGVLAATVIIPGILWNLRGRIEADLTFRFLGWIALTHLLQLLVLTAGEVWRAADWRLLVMYHLPWAGLLVSWIVITAASFSFILLGRDWLLSQRIAQ